MGYCGRDVEVSFAGKDCIVVACDSCGAIGEKELDVVKVPNYISGRFTMRVALFEVLATGAKPQIAAVTICNEPNSTGEGILRGVREELVSAGLAALPLAISCEKNVPTRQTGLGVTVVGQGETPGLRIGKTQNNDRVYCLGMPKVGNEVNSADDPEIVQAEHLRLLLENPKVHDIIPVGSQGILGEIAILAKALNLSFLAAVPMAYGKTTKEASGTVPDIHKSGGPATCIIFTAEQELAEEFWSNSFPKDLSSVPIFQLGTLSKLNECK